MVLERSGKTMSAITDILKGIIHFQFGHVYKISYHSKIDYADNLRAAEEQEVNDKTADDTMVQLHEILSGIVERLE